MFDHYFFKKLFYYYYYYYFYYYYYLSCSCEWSSTSLKSLANTFNYLYVKDEINFFQTGSFWLLGIKDQIIPNFGIVDTTKVKLGIILQSTYLVTTPVLKANQLK